MKIINQSSKILNISTRDPLKTIEKAARNCYQSKSGDAEKFIKSLIRKKHMTPFEMVDIQVELITDLGVMAEITRHRHASFNIESTRYVNYKNGIEVVIPVGLKPEKVKDLYCKEYQDQYQKFMAWKRAMMNSEKSYQEMITAGCVPQIARAVLPKGLKTKIIMKTNIRDWLNIFDLRTSKSAHPQIQDLMTNLRSLFQEKIPVIFDV